ncbi:helix-turn-helix transcriptional regulator [Thauera butanivorans]|uniref:helix-turn-helix transcriptional regulator n=1 Tax=Thauera butanivorans TaxID=86174 RepID=UPI003AB7872B
METKIYLDRTEAAAWLTARGLRFSASTLQKLVTVGGGPIYRRFGRRAVYQVSDLEDWANERLSVPRRSSFGQRGAA